MKYLLALFLALVTGCAQIPTKCVESHSPGISIQSTDPRIASFKIDSTVTTVCVSPGYVETK